MGFIKKTLLLKIKSWRFILPVILIFAAMSFSLFTEELKDYSVITQNDFVKVFLMGYQGSYAIFPAVVLLIATVPYASQYVDNYKSGVEKYILARRGKNKYFADLFVLNAILSWLTVGLGMTIYLLFTYLMFDHQIDREFYDQLIRVSAYSEIAKRSIPLYIGLIILHCSCFCAVFSELGFAISFYIKKKLVAWLSPFIISVVLSLFAIFGGITKLEPMAILDISRVTNTTPVFIVGYMMIVFIGSYFIAKIKFKKDFITDEEF